MDRLNGIAKTIVNHSLKIKENDCVLIKTYSDKTMPLVVELIDEIASKNACAFVKMTNEEIEAKLINTTNDKRLLHIANEARYEVENYDCFISIFYNTNDYTNKNVNVEIKKKIDEVKKEYDDIRINKKRWVLLNYPSHLDAYKAKMTNEEFLNYSLNAMNEDYAKMYNDMQPLVKLMERTDKVRIIGPNTDINFSIKDIPVVPCAGECNIPDGEVFTAPVRESVNGIITYNTPSPYRGFVFNDICLEFENGKIIKATASNNQEMLDEIFNTDEGARYIGEFSLGLNPKITKPMGDILFDEKIIGSLHFTPGKCYDDAPNGNVSNIHWDLVLIQKDEYGGGEIYFDDVLIRKDGVFVLEELKHLNYDLS